MGQIITIARRELSSQFFSPIAYVVIGVFGFGSALIFDLHFQSGAAASLQMTFSGLVWLMIFLAPAISMRLISEEFRSGTAELLMTAPISDTEIVLGKWLGAMGFLAAMFVPLVLLALVLEWNGSPDWGPILVGLLGLILVGGLYLAIGTFASSLSQNQIVAFIVTVFIVCIFTIAMFFLPQASWVPTGLGRAMLYINVNQQFDTFNKGLLVLPNVIFFLSGIVLFLFLAVKKIESRRWR
ncbi:MAG: hypothetical protein CMJ18_15620 [Phycisphaeraceae bacterium]|nr:hypothetical protein [Phycisphaeraceae bacterium]